jgi:hypothetical protein
MSKSLAETVDEAISLIEKTIDTRKKQDESVPALQKRVSMCSDATTIFQFAECVFDKLKEHNDTLATYLKIKEIPHEDEFGIMDDFLKKNKQKLQANNTGGGMTKLEDFKRKKQTLFGKPKKNQFLENVCVRPEEVAEIEELLKTLGICESARAPNETLIDQVVRMVECAKAKIKEQIAKIDEFNQKHKEPEEHGAKKAKQ